MLCALPLTFFSCFSSFPLLLSWTLISLPSLMSLASFWASTLAALPSSLQLFTHVAWLTYSSDASQQSENVCTVLNCGDWNNFKISAMPHSSQHYLWSPIFTHSDYMMFHVSLFNYVADFLRSLKTQIRSHGSFSKCDKNMLIQTWNSSCKNKIKS